MKVLHINYTEKTGGAGIAAYRHYEAMQQAGIDTSMLVILKTDNSSPNIETPTKNKYLLFIFNHLYLLLHSILLKIHKPFASFSFSFWGFKLHNHQLVKNADVIYLHWINNAMLSIKEIEKILKTGKKVYWYMHDMYPLTGGCHHVFECAKYQSECKNCPFVGPLKGIDLIKTQFNNKVNSLKKYENLNVITPSRWLADCAAKSTIFKEHNITVFPNVLNLDKFKPLNKSFAKELIGVNKEKTILLFGADNIKSPYKGWSYLKKALNLLDPNKFECLVFGHYNKIIESEINIKTTFTGYLKDDYSLISVYNASDIFISPSLADNFPNVILEAMACGLPCVGFNVGGIPDLIHHKITGYLAIYKNYEDLSRGINWILNSDYELLSQKSREFVLNNCSYEKYKSYTY